MSKYKLYCYNEIYLINFATFTSICSLQKVHQMPAPFVAIANYETRFHIKAYKNAYISLELLCTIYSLLTDCIFSLFLSSLGMDGVATLSDHPEAPFNGLLPGLNGIGLGVQVTMTPQHAAALMHHLSAGGGVPISAAANNLLKLNSKPLTVREPPPPPPISSAQINGSNASLVACPGQAVVAVASQSGGSCASSNSQSSSQSGALVPVSLEVANGANSAGGDSSSGRSTPTNNDLSSSAKLFVGGLSWTTSSEKLRQYFSMFGNVTDVLIMRDPLTQVRFCGEVFY